MTRPRPRPPFTRRAFVTGTFAATALATTPWILPSRVFGASAPSNRIRVGQIGCGRIARSHDMPGVARSGLADVLGVCDVDTKRLSEGRGAVEQLYRELNMAMPAITEHVDYREVLARKDIDAVVISTPDHWHAEIALAAVLAGKDVYLQKPFTLTHEEGVLLRDAVARTGRILQVGSQQRSWEQFRRACEVVRSGRIGNVRRVEIGLPIDPTKANDPEQPIPKNLDYDRWLGPTPRAYYTEQRVHPQNDYSRPGWLRNENYCLGMITGWGSHHFDTLHWALDMDHSGPSRIEARAEFPKRDAIWNVHGAYDISLTYPGDIRVTVSDKHPNGLKFFGDEGWVWVTREGQTTSSDPKSSAANLPPLDASSPRVLDPQGLKVELPRSTSHHLNWLKSVTSRTAPLAPASTGHRSGSACIVSWIAMRLARPLTWDVNTERFVNDAEANALLSRAERAPYGVKEGARRRVTT
jgi:myo-inositol 2-dehydrogenase / D-chiro-inositol 1-dehydrogenase